MRAPLGLLAGLLSALLLTACTLTAPSPEARIGVVLMHGKGGTARPNSPTGQLARTLTDAGYIVVTPDMPWQRNRIWDRGFAGSMTEIDEHVATLKRKGARRIVVGGHSLGANAALGYGAQRDNLAGILAIAPGHIPEVQGFQRRTGHDYLRARTLIDAGRGDRQTLFKDVSQGRVRHVSATPVDYLDWYAPDGPAVMPTNAANIAPGTPLMWIIGEEDRMLRFGRDRTYAFDRAPAHPKSVYRVVGGGHRQTPVIGAPDILDWLKSL